MRLLELPHVTRITVVPRNRAATGYEGWNLFEGCEIHLQDDGRTLKVFPLPEQEEGSPDAVVQS